VSLALGSAHADRAEAQSFDYVFCNRTGLTAYIAIVVRLGISDTRFEARGWYAAPPRQCINTGNYPSGYAYYYAEDGQNGFWGSDHVTLCVQYPGPFQRVLTNNYTCRSNERLRGFTEVRAEPDIATMTINLNP
jgi:uncharacterized membrane protein